MMLLADDGMRNECIRRVSPDPPPAEEPIVTVKLALRNDASRVCGMGKPLKAVSIPEK